MPRGAKPLGDRAMTVGERQAKRRVQFNEMRTALERILHAANVEDARAIAAEVLASVKRSSESTTPVSR